MRRAALAAAVVAGALAGSVPATASDAGARRLSRRYEAITAQALREVRPLRPLATRRYAQAFRGGFCPSGADTPAQSRLVDATLMIAALRTRVVFLPALQRFVDRLALAGGGDPVLQRGARGWRTYYRFLARLPWVARSPCARIRLWRRHGHAAAYAPLATAAARRFHREDIVAIHAYGSIVRAAGRLHALGASAPVAFGFEGGILTFTPPPPPDLPCADERPRGAHRLVHTHVPRALRSILGVLRRPQRPRDRPPALELRDSSYASVYVDETRRLGRVAGSTYYLVPVRLAVEGFVSRRCLRSLHGAARRRAARRNARLRRQKPTFNLCLVSVRRDGSGASCGVQRAADLRGPVDLFGDGGDVTRYSALVPDEVATVEVIYRRPNRDLRIRVRDNLLAYGIRRARGDFPVRLIERDAAGRVIRSDALP